MEAVAVQIAICKDAAVLWEPLWHFLLIANHWTFVHNTRSPAGLSLCKVSLL